MYRAESSVRNQVLMIIRSTMRHTLFLFALSAALLASIAPAHAALSLTMPSATFYTSDGTDTLDVLLSSDGIDSVGGFTLNFQITSDSSNASTPLETLQFVSPPIATSTDKTLTADNYLFKGNSFDTTNDVPFGGTSAGDTQLTVHDSTNFDTTTLSFPDVSFSGDKLVARITFQVPSSATNPAGDKFDITLTNPDTAFSSNAAAAADPINNPFGYVPLAGDFTGTITVESPSFSPVPEPGTCGMMLAGVVGLALARRKRRTGSGSSRNP